MLTMSGEEVTKELIEDIFNIIDEDGNGIISCDEFLSELLKC